MDPYTHVGEKARFYQNVSSHCLSVVRLQVSVCLSLSVPDLIPIPKFTGNGMNFKNPLFFNSNDFFNQG